ncbi:hypothetical protein [Microbispora sp. CA-102843]|uniref:hypothetical protein n=1 Tax=Microbispora sp. CA-102843 TaxID=3239952 RepID=UPI003D935F47
MRSVLARARAARGWPAEGGEQAGQGQSLVGVGRPGGVWGKSWSMAQAGGPKDGSVHFTGAWWLVTVRR